MKSIYLAGPISGLTWEEASAWRNSITAVLTPSFTVLNPLLATDIKHVSKITGTFGDGYDVNHIERSMFFARDMDWVRQADIILANFTHIAEKPGAGTPYELGAAWALNKMTIVVGPVENIPLFPNLGASLSVPTIEMATEFLLTL